MTEAQQTAQASRRYKPARNWVLLPVLSMMLATLVVLVAVVVDRSTPNPLSGATPPVPILLEAQRRGAVASDGVQVEAEIRPGRQVSSSARGVVTALPLRVGIQLSSGDRIVAVNDKWVVAYVSQVPPYRDIGPGARGADVVRLQTFLASTAGYLGALDGDFGAATSRAVARFNRSLGRSDLRSVFAQDSVAWIGPKPLTVGKVETALGVELARLVFTGESRVAAAIVTEPQGGLTTPDESKTLVVGDVSVGYKSGTGRVTDAASVAKLAGVLPDSKETAGRVTSADAQMVLTLPASSIVSDAAGGTCVFTDIGSQPVMVSPIGGGVATVDVPADTPFDVVLSNPGDFPWASSCS